MSTDVYMDFTNPTTGEEKPVRIGFLAIMLYFEPYLYWLQDVAKSHPVVTEETIKMVEAKARIFDQEVKVMQDMSPELFQETYGYAKPAPGDGEGCWDDRLAFHEVRETMTPYLGWNWSTRTD